MSDIQITITNADRIIAAFRKAPILMRKALPKAINRSLLTIGAKAAKNAPVLTGNLRSSILDPDRGLTLADDSHFFGSVGSGVGYGAFVEEGTRFQRAQPYLGPAVEDAGRDVERFFTDMMDGVISDIERNSR